MESLLQQMQSIDTQLSNRTIDLDPAGYFLIYLDRSTSSICADHYSNSIDDRGIACDPETGEPLPCSGKPVRTPTQCYRAATAKALCIELFENPEARSTVSRFDHAAYLGREFVRAELALANGVEYVQD